MKMILTLFFIILYNTVSSQNIESDDLYYNLKDRKIDTVQVIEKNNRVRKRVYNYYDPSPTFFYRYQPNWYYPYSYPFEFYRNRTVVIIPKTQDNVIYQRRPSREGNNIPNRGNGRGRN